MHDENDIFQLAVSFINQSNRSVFLTGKAGTGKTTFLRHIAINTHKKAVIAAPTGVAAMNAGGMTLHSLFWLPFGLFIDEDDAAMLEWSDRALYNRRRLFSTVKLTRKKRMLLREIELLIIDEVSMVRADVLDAIDALLRSVRRDARPFGGLQMLFIGDLFQLPPVVKDEEWQIMSRYYPSPYFFDANVLKELPPLVIELEKIYRQQDPEFIEILNAIRSNRCTPEQLNQLHAYYDPDFIPPEEEPYVTITSHNHLANGINERALSALADAPSNFSARIKGEFSVGLFPADAELILKPGAQVMFIRNDSGEDRKYYNGKIGRIKHIDGSGDQILVAFDDGTGEVEVKREVWENIKYDYQQDTNMVSEEVMGTFSQFPLRLAWAITIHKSQGLTFNRAIIDAGASFAPGQVYVALSRLTGLEGMVLKSRITSYSIRTDSSVLMFAESRARAVELPRLLAEAQQDYLGQILMDTFYWGVIPTNFQDLLVATEKRSIPQKQEAIRLIDALMQTAEAHALVAERFRHELHRLLKGKDVNGAERILDRTRRAIEWFMPRLEGELMDPLEKHMKEWTDKTRTKRYVVDLQRNLQELKRKHNQMTHCLEITENLIINVSL